MNHDVHILHTLDGDYELNAEDILLNENPVLPGERHPYNMRLWVIGHEFGPIVALWATNEQDAFDEMVDKDYEHFLIEGPEEVHYPDERGIEITRLGNAGDPCDLTYAWIHPAVLQPERDLALILAFAEARGARADHLGEI